MRGPLDVLKETWVADKRSNQNVLSYVLLMWERMEAMGSCVQEISRHLSAKQIKELRQLLAKFGEVFQPLPAHSAIAEHRIMTGETIPTRLPPYRIPHAYQDDVQHELMEMLDHGVIECSSSDWASPLVVVKKKDSSLRLCVAYWCLNSLSKTYAYRIP